LIPQHEGPRGAPASSGPTFPLLALPRVVAPDTKRLAFEFTFDWFFAGDNRQWPAKAIKEAALCEMVEAQAHIIAVSPAIVVEDRPGSLTVAVKIGSAPNR
jgi:hypothetical protein